MTGFTIGERIRVIAARAGRRLTPSGRVLDVQPVCDRQGRPLPVELCLVRFDSGQQHWLPAGWLGREPRPDFTPADWASVGWQPNPFIAANISAWMRELRFDPYRRCRD